MDSIAAVAWALPALSVYIEFTIWYLSIKYEDVIFVYPCWKREGEKEKVVCILHLFEIVDRPRH